MMWRPFSPSAWYLPKGSYPVLALMLKRLQSARMFAVGENVLLGTDGKAA